MFHNRMTKQSKICIKITDEVEPSVLLFLFFDHLNEAEYISAYALQVINYPNLRHRLGFLLAFYIAYGALI